MTYKKNTTESALASLRAGENFTLRQECLLVLQLSIPAIMAQISTIIMQYIDASMVGQLGAGGSASIGLVSSSTWLVNGIASALGTGFSVQVAHRIGANDPEGARRILRQSLLGVALFSGLMALIGFIVSGNLPIWLGGASDIAADAGVYFAIFCLALPISQVSNAAAGMLQCSGNMKTPSILHILMCGLDVVFNSVLIFPTRSISLGGAEICIPGAGMGVAGAALGTGLSHAVVALVMLYFLLVKSETLHLRKGEHLRFVGSDWVRAIKIAVPIAMENFVLNAAQVTAIRIVAPLGTASIAANSLSVTAEGLVYMPGYGIGTAATTLIGQCYGAERHDLSKRLGWLTVFLGMGVMTITGAIMFVFAPQMIGMLSPDPTVRALGTTILRIEAFAEPMYGASIVASGVFRGMGDTLAPSLMNFFSMWAVRIPLAAVLARTMGLKGVWIAMCTELCVRGAIFLIRLARKNFSPVKVTK